MIKAFIERTNIEALKGLKSRNKIESRIQTLISVFLDHRDHLLHLCTSLQYLIAVNVGLEEVRRDSESLRKLKLAIQSLMKNEKRRPTLDNLGIVGHKYQKHFPEFQKRFEDLTNQFCQDSSLLLEEEEVRLDNTRPNRC